MEADFKEIVHLLAVEGVQQGVTPLQAAMSIVMHAGNFSDEQVRAGLQGVQEVIMAEIKLMAEENRRDGKMHMLTNEGSIDLSEILLRADNWF